MKQFYLLIIAILLSTIIPSVPLNAQSPPFGGTIFLDPDIITPEDPTTFLQLESSGRGIRTMFDRRVNDWISVNAYLFNASFDDGLTTEIQVNPEFGSAEVALSEAEKYAPAIGQLPTALRKDAETVWIHKGVNPFGGGNRNILIHTGQADLYVADGILEETLVHEASHTSLDDPHATSAGWRAAQSADPTFISTYAQEFPNREDIAESFLLYLALRFKPDRIDANLKNTIQETISNRIAYFDEQMLNMHPVGLISSISENNPMETVTISPNPFQEETTLTYNLTQSEKVSLHLYTLQGQQVDQILSSTVQIAGSHQFKIRANHLTTGVYFIHLQIGKNNILRKIMIH